MLAEGQLVEAQRFLLKSLTARHMPRVDESQVAGYLAWLGRATYALGNRIEAQRYLLEASEIALESRAISLLMDVMAIIPVALADNEEAALKERAVELYALAESRPFVANSQLFEDIAGKQVAAAAATLPPDVVEAAQARGQALDWRETADALLIELHELGWDEG